MSTPADSGDGGLSGIELQWSSAPSGWPSTVDGVTLERARFLMSSLRVVGDAGPGDPRTTQSAMELGFAWPSTDQRPTTITFDAAPTGLYSQVAIVFDGGINSWWTPIAVGTLLLAFILLQKLLQFGKTQHA
jgi:hypothetical protein